MRRRDILQRSSAEGRAHQGPPRTSGPEKREEGRSELVAKMAIISTASSPRHGACPGGGRRPDSSWSSPTYSTTPSSSATARGQPQRAPLGREARLRLRAKPHWDIGENLKILRFACVRRSRAPASPSTGQGAKLEGPLKLHLDLHTFRTLHGGVPPFMVNKESMTARGSSQVRAVPLQGSRDGLLPHPHGRGAVTNIHATRS
jgi:hypothetical protein